MQINEYYPHRGQLCTFPTSPSDFTDSLPLHPTTNFHHSLNSQFTPSPHPPIIPQSSPNNISNVVVHPHLLDPLCGCPAYRGCKESAARTSSALEKENHSDSEANKHTAK